MIKSLIGAVLGALVFAVAALLAGLVMDWFESGVGFYTTAGVGAAAGLAMQPGGGARSSSRWTGACRSIPTSRPNR